ncbi:Flagellar assembly factor FliW [Anoxybacillus ayderensis]|uniref:Flagellar assembly factor FliW n=1 Tax=Anoxybacillus ayderensis TaxID=265546 RepID=A0A0D0HTS6_9BACL|nr:flagellar assembly protein FliW [Anoxybacillus ayderensis]KIP21273.1 Flagellar assembly factor FliW [Anoxybacillus ayderensis]
MNIETKYHGTIELSDMAIVSFENGLPGFEHEKQFVLLPIHDSPFTILQSVKNKDVAFVMIEPFSYFPTYEVELDDTTCEQLNIQAENDVALYVILTVAEPFTNTTANLQAPVVINVHERIGKQVILTNTPYKTKHRLFPEMVEAK